MKSLLVVLITLLGITAIVQRTVGTQSPAPEAGPAVMQMVLEERRKSAMESQETNQGYVIDPALASRMLADTGLVIRSVALRGLGPERIARAELEVPGKDGPVRLTRYATLVRQSPSEWKATAPATALMWETKVW